MHLTVCFGQNFDTHFFFNFRDIFIVINLCLFYSSLFRLFVLLQRSLRQSQVFQLDPLRGKDASEILDSGRQQAISGAILRGITDILNGPELDSSLRDWQLEITQVLKLIDIRTQFVSRKKDSVKQDKKRKYSF